MWDDSRAALADLDLGGRTRILDVGCGTGEFTRVLAEAADARVVGVDADTDLLSVAADRAGIEAVAGDATRLPFAADSFDLVVCQALLVNLPDPTAALSEFARVSSDLVATVEPDNAAVGVDSTVEAEAALDRRVRDAFPRRRGDRRGARRPRPRAVRRRRPLSRRDPSVPPPQADRTAVRRPRRSERGQEGDR